MLAVEIIDGCNFKCWFCNAKDVKKNTYMDIKLFRDVIIQAKDLGIKIIDMVPSKGEPFLHPKIYEMLDFVNLHMEEIIIFSNATAINVQELKKVNLTKTKLGISFYGSNVKKFNQLTGMNEKLFKIFNNKIKELSEYNIPHTIERRDINYEFTKNKEEKNKDFDSSLKCKFHSVPKILYNGDVTFCRFSKNNIIGSNKIIFANVNDVSLEEALQNPIRYKFFDSQSICSKLCDSFDADCRIKQTISSVKFMMKSKINYKNNLEFVEKQYKDLEKDLNIL